MYKYILARGRTPGLPTLSVKTVHNELDLHVQIRGLPDQVTITGNNSIVRRCS